MSCNRQENAETLTPTELEEQLQLTEPVERWEAQRVGSDAMWVMEVSGLAVLKGLPVLAYHPDCITTTF